MSQKKYTTKESTTPPPVNAFRGLTKSLQFHLLKLFIGNARAVWVVRGPDANQTVAGPATNAIVGMTIQDRFSQGLHEVFFTGTFSVPALAASAKMRFTLDGSATLGDHTSQWQSLQVANPTGGFLADVIDMPEGTHMIGVEVYGEADSVTVYANGCSLMVRQL